MTILFAVNLTEPPEACRRVADLVNRCNAKLVVLHVHASAAPFTVADPMTGLSEPSYAPFDPELQESLDKREEQEFRAFLRKSFDQTVESTLGKGNPADVILASAADREVDLIVVGKRHHSPIEKFLMGDTATRVVEHADRPVLLVPIQESR